MEKLRETFEFLQSKETNSLEIWDVENDVKIESKGYRPNLTSYDAFRAEINLLINSYEKVGLQKIKKNGNALIRHGAMQQVTIKQNTDVDRGGARSNPLPSQHQNYMGMAGAQPQGLSYADIGKLTQFDEVKEEKKSLQEKCDSLKEKNSELEKEILKMSLGKESKPGAIEKLLENPDLLAQIATVIGQAISKGGNAAQQLQQGMNAPQLSQVKQKLITDLVSLDPDDAVVMRLIYLMKCYEEGNSTVIQEFEKLYKNATSQHSNQ